MMEAFSDAELEEALRKAFVDQQAAYIIVDDRRQRFRISSANLGVREGWLEGTFEDFEEDQYSRYVYRLTEAGLSHFGLKGSA